MVKTHLCSCFQFAQTDAMQWYTVISQCQKANCTLTFSIISLYVILTVCKTEKKWLSYFIQFISSLSSLSPLSLSSSHLSSLLVLCFLSSSRCQMLWSVFRWSIPGGICLLTSGGTPSCSLLSPLPPPCSILHSQTLLVWRRLHWNCKNPVCDSDFWT